MSLLDGNSAFSQAPSNPIRRSTFDRSNTHLTTFNAGLLVPVYTAEVYPGDTVKMDMNMIVRGTTPLAPVMDNSFIDIHWFFVPNRLLWDHWKEFMGETTDPWLSPVEYEVPERRVTAAKGGLTDHFELPIGVYNVVNDLPYRAYQMIWNEWYRDQATQYAQLINTGDAVANGDLTLLPVNKYRDYFTSCLPSPQRGDPVTVSLGTFAPVHTRNVDISNAAVINYPQLKWYNSVALDPNEAHAIYGNTFGIDPTVSTNYAFTAIDATPSGSTKQGSATPVNLWADISGVSGITVNVLRQAFAIQRLLETDARSGTRYRELVRAHFGADIGDARVQVPEYLGGKHIPISIMQVLQQSADNASTDQPLGTTGAVSKTFDSDHYFIKSFVEHGWLIGLASVRTSHTYQQGVNRQWLRRTKYDYYWPEFANLGEQPVYECEIYNDGTNIASGAVFGYQEAYADLRYKPNVVTGGMRSNAPDSYDIWHYADYYQSKPFLSDTWMRETDANIARTLAVADPDLADQYLAQFWFNSQWTRPMPLYSIPGLSKL